MRLPRGRRFSQACEAREAWGQRKGYDGWKKHPAEIAAEMQEEAVDIPVWGKGVSQHPLTLWQRSLLAVIRPLAGLVWYLTEALRQSLEKP